jgi:tripartite-type tricarboxylate transporter receptor subunit TctC
MEKKLIGFSIMMKRTLMYFFMAGFFVTGFSALILAQEYPTQPITMVAGTVPGGLPDVAGRVLADEAKKLLGVDILVINKPGATQTVGASYVISKPPDGYTLGVATDAPFVRAPHMMALNFDPIKDSLPIIIFANMHSFIVTRADSPFRTFKEVIDFARENPGKLTYGDGGIGTNYYLGFAGLALQMGFKFTHIPHGGDAPTTVALLGGHIMVAGISGGICVPQIKAGKMRLLAVADGIERLEAFPQVPTFYEFSGDVIPSPGLIIFGPKGLPLPIVKKLEDAFSKASQSPAFKKWALDNEVYPLKKFITGQELRDYLEAEYKKTGELYRRLGVKPQS